MSADAGLLRVYPNGSSSPLGSPLPKEGLAQQLAAIDAQRSVYYILGFEFETSKPNLIGPSLADGSVVSSATLPFVESAFVGVGQFLAVEPL